MVKRSDVAKANKPHKSRSPKEGHAQRSGRQARPDTAEDHRKKNHEIRPSAGNDKAFDDVEKKVSVKKSKDGCLPKVLMMFLLFSVVGTFVYFSS